MKTRKRDRVRHKFRSMMQCISVGDQVRANDMISAPGSIGGAGLKLDSGDIEEAESSLRESGILNFEEARAMLGRYEYQKGNVEAALHVFEGIEMNTIIPKIKATLSRSLQPKRRYSQNDDDLPMSTHAASLLLEAIFLKAKSLQAVGKFTEAAQSCKVILDIVESSLPDGLPENFGTDSKLQETLIKAVELLPELWKLAICPEEAIPSYRRALLYHWNLDIETTARIQKEFAIYLLYSGNEAGPPYLTSEMHSFIPENNLEEAILLLMLLLRKANNHMIVWDPAILDHLSFALSVSGLPRALARVVEELLPRVIERKQMYHTLALCYHGDGDNFAALNLIREMLAVREEAATFDYGLLVASKICCESPKFAEEGVRYARRALKNLGGRCGQIVGAANFVLGMSLTEHARSAVSNSERIERQTEAIDALEIAGNLTELKDATIVYQLSLQFAERRKLASALHYAKHLLKLDGGSNLKGWVLMARILSAQKKFVDAETIIDAALEQSVERDHGQLLRTKAKLQVAQGRLKDAIKTYTQLLAVFHILSTFESAKQHHKVTRNYDQQLESETWHDLVYIYISLSSWNDVDACLSKLRSINPYSASRWHALGSLHEAKGLFREAMEAFTVALSIEPEHVPSLISSAVTLRHLTKDNKQSYPIIRGFLMQALSLDRMNHLIWYELGLMYKAQGDDFMNEAAESFDTATVLEDTAPVEPFIS